MLKKLYASEVDKRGSEESINGLTAGIGQAKRDVLFQVILREAVRFTRNLFLLPENRALNL